MNHPQLSELHQIYLSETQPFRKVHRMIDLFESIIKTHTVVIMAEYFKRNEWSDTAKGMLAAGLRTPSLGIWQLFSRELHKELTDLGHQFMIPGFSKEFKQLDDALNNAKTNVVSFRNGYAHGATPSDDDCTKDILHFEPFLVKLLSFDLISASKMIEVDGRVMLQSMESGNQLSLSPIMVYKPDGDAQPFVFFNDLKNDKVGLLNYPLSRHYRDKEFYQEFHKQLPITEWKKSGNNEFYQRIEELTETFKGRTQEREKLLQFVNSNNKGFFSIQGNPGIGKSALIAQFFKDLKTKKGKQHFHIVEYFIRRGTAQAQVEYLFNYLINRTDELFPAGKEIRAEGKAIWDLQQQLFSKWRLWGEQSNGMKLLFLIDGLDEGVDNNIVTYLPRENFDSVLFIYGSRPGGHKTIDELWTQLPVEHHTKLELSGLGKEDIRALIYEVANKYEIDRDSNWIDAVQQRSQGNPLYLKLLCDALENGSITLNDIGALPEKIDEYYKAILDRYARDSDGDALLNALFTFAAAKDYLTFAHIANINTLGEATLHRITSTLKEVLFENPLTEDVLDYQLFHESFREYLLKEKGNRVNDAAERIIDFCAAWKELEGTWEQRYSLEYYATHLSESKKEERANALIQLIYNQEYTAAQKKVLKEFDASNEMYRLALKKSCELQHNEDMLEAALCLVDLKYEEANDAPQIVSMVANGEIDLALKRIESFGGSDKDGMKRKFILYMLCLLELTLLESKDKPFVKEAIHKLLENFDKQILIDHTIVDWDNYFPSYLIFLISCECAKHGFDYMVLYSRTKIWDSKWLKKINKYSNFNFEVIINIANNLVSEKDEIFLDISIILAKQGNYDDSINVANRISYKESKYKAIGLISCELVKCGDTETSLKMARDILDVRVKVQVLSAISVELDLIGKKELSSIVINEALETAREIRSIGSRVVALNNILPKLLSLEKMDLFNNVLFELLEIINDISSEKLKNIELQKTCSNLARIDKIDLALDLIGNISNDSIKNKVFYTISLVLAKKSEFDESLNVLQKISDNWYKNKLFKYISIEFAKIGKIEDALKIIYDIPDEYEKGIAFSSITCELTSQGNIDTALGIVNNISNINIKDKSICSIAGELAIKNNIQFSYKILMDSLVIPRGLTNEFIKIEHLSELIVVLWNNADTDLSKRLIQKSLSIANNVIDSTEKSKVLFVICQEFVKIGYIDKAIAIAQDIRIEWIKIKTLLVIYTDCVAQNNIDKSKLILQDVFRIAQNITELSIKDWSLAAISLTLLKSEKFQKSIELAGEIADEGRRSITLFSIYIYLVNIGKETLSNFEQQESIKIVQSMPDRFLDRKSITLSCIALELIKIKQFDLAITLLNESVIEMQKIPSGRKKNGAVRSISECYLYMGDFDLAAKIGFEILDFGGRSECWLYFANILFEKVGVIESLLLVNKFENDEIKLFYKKGWVNILKVMDVDANLVQVALPLIIGDSLSMESLLRKYAIKNLFLRKDLNENINRLNQTLNIQWALDIIDKFPKKVNSRNSQNVSDWIDGIADEDDQEQILLWAKQVSKGKISEEEFLEKLNSLKNII